MPVDCKMIEKPTPSVIGSRITPGLIAIAMGFGAISAIPAIFLESAGAANIYLGGVQELDLMVVIMAVIIAPIVEETVKPLGLYLTRKESSINLRLIDWAILGLFAGLGFKIVEDLLYIVFYFNMDFGAEGMLAGALLRIHFPTHLIATAISGFGIGLWHQTRRIGYLIIAILLAILLHGAFNLSLII